MADKTIKTRIIQKHDTKANWDKATNFIPKLGELIFYTDLNRIKMGDGVKTVVQLPFLADTYRPIQVNGTEILDDDNTAPLNLKAGSNVTLSNSSGTVTIAATDTNTHRTIQMNGTQILADNTTPLNLKAGTNVSLTNSSGTVTISATDTNTTDLTQMTGILPLSKGGTGRSISDDVLTRQNEPFKNRIPRLSDPSNGEDTEMKFIQPKSGALYATETNGKPEFGTLPVAQGGTGATDAATARTNLGITKANLGITDTDENVKSTVASASTIYYLTGSTSSAQTTSSLVKNEGVRAIISSSGAASIRLGNEIASGSSGALYGALRIYDEGTNYTILETSSLTDNRNIYLPDKNGTIALLSDIPTDTDTHRPIQVNGTQILGNNTTALNLKAGTNVTLSNSSGTVTINATDTNTTDLTQMTGILELEHGGTGRNLSTVTENSIMRKTEEGLKGIIPVNGVLYYNSSEANPVPKFGTLPVAQGGTGATDAAAARTNLGITKANLGITDTDENVKSTITTGYNYYLTGSTSSETNTGKLIKHTGIRAYADSDSETNGVATIRLGNETASGTAGAKYGTIRLYGEGTNYTAIKSGAPTANRTIELPDKSGTVALMSDIPTDTDTTDLTQMTGVLELNHGGTGRNLSSISDNCIIRKSNSSDSVQGFYGIVPSSGALYYSGANNAVPQFGTLPIAQGGTGATNGAVALNNEHLIGDLNSNYMSTTLTDDTVILTSSTYGFNDDNKILYKRNLTGLYNYIKGKTDSLYSTTDENVKVTTGNSGTGAVTYYLTSVNSSSNTYTGDLRKHASANLYVSADSNTTGAISLRLGNTTATNTAGSKYGYIRLYGTGTNYVDIKPGAQSDDHTITIPDASGTMALRSMIRYGTSAPSGTTGDVGDIYIRYTA